MKRARFSGHRELGSIDSGVYDDQTKSFSKEFKLEAVRQLGLGDKAPNDIAIDFGIRSNTESIGSDSIEIQNQWQNQWGQTRLKS